MSNDFELLGRLLLAAVLVGTLFGAAPGERRAPGLRRVSGVLQG